MVIQAWLHKETDYSFKHNFSSFVQMGCCSESYYCILILFSDKNDVLG